MNTPDVRALEVVRRLPAGPVVGVEVGVYRGEMSACLLRLRGDLTLHMVDSWSPETAQPEHYRRTADPRAHMDEGQQEEALRAAIDATAFARTRRHLYRQDSTVAAAHLPDGLDFVFIDADHSYEGTRADVLAWAPKVRRGGLLGGHDYGMWEERGFGVRRAVDELAGAFGWSVELGADSTWFVRP